MTEAFVPTNVEWDTKIAVVLLEGLLGWQELNITAFVTSGIAATVENVTGEEYEDASGNKYLPMFQQPVLIFSASPEKMRQVYERAMRREVPLAIYTEDVFKTNNDKDNRAVVKAVEAEKLALVGLAMRADAKTVDKIVKGAALHS